MNKIGFDFGTTNSAISFYNEETKALDNFRIGASANDYIPTVVAYKEGGEIYIGDIAKNNVTKKAFDTYEYFKLRLGSDFDKKIEGKDKTALSVTKDYIREILEEYKREQGISSIDSVVMTVPETWFREASNRTARDNIQAIYSELGYDENFRLESEPVAAAGYFCWSYQKNTEKKYTGTIVVVDYGGGTLDVTLCSVEKGEKIIVLERCGQGEYNNTNGCAGVAFDEAVVESLIEKHKLGIEKGSKQFIKLRDEFEKNKIGFTETISKMLKDYYDEPEMVEDEELFTLGDDEIGVYCEDLAKCFEKVNKPYLDDSLKQMQNFFEVHKIDPASQTGFKVLMVGGFSNFYCVEETVRNFFGSKANVIDKRFDTPLNIKNKSLAISRGAALIAQNVVKVEHTCTHDIGYIVVRPDDNDRWVDKDILIIQKGTKLTDVKSAKYAETRVSVKSKSGALRIFMDDGRSDGKGRTNAALDQTLSELFPNIDKPDNEYTIGFSVDKNLIPTVHIKDKNGAENKTSLNKLIERLSIREVR